jgi:putative phosphoesterase
MRIGVISDTHIPDRAKGLPKEILQVFKDVDMIIHTGDFVSVAVLNKLKSLCGNIKAVAGNMDSQKVKTKLPEKEIVKVGNYKIGIAHGYGHPNGLIDYLTKLFKNDDVDIIVFGHSHTPLNKKIGDILFFNPGSPTDKIFSPYNAYGIIEITDKIDAKIIKIEN